MPQEERYPVFDGSIENYLAQMTTFTKKRQKRLYDNVRDEFDVILKSYCYTHMITGLVHSSYKHHNNDDDEVFTRNFVRWAGLWFRVIESLNILQDSMILGLEGRSSSAFNLLRPALESIVNGVFYYCISQTEYREKAKTIKDSDKGRKSGKIIDLVEEVIRTTKDKDSIPVELERQLTRMSLDYDSEIYLPKFSVMVDQIEEWKIIDEESEEGLSDILYSNLFKKLSSYSHSVYHVSYAGRGIESRNHDVLFGWDVDFDSFKEYSNHFRFACIIIILFFLNLTEEIQKTQSFYDMMSEYIKNHPDMHSVLGTIPEQIQDFIYTNRSAK
jgi:hypothetical protein